MKKLIQILRTVLGWSSKTFGSENVNITYLDIFCVWGFFKQTKQNTEIYTGFAKNVSSIKMTFCNEKLFYASPPPLLLTACTELFRKIGRLSHTRNTLCACRGVHTCKPTSGWWCLHRKMQPLLREPLPATTWVERRNLRLVQEINSSILCLSHVDQPSHGGRCSRLHPCCWIQHWRKLGPAIKPGPVDPWAGPNLCSPWALQQEGVRKDSLGAIINTGCTANTSLQTIWVSEAYFPWELLVLANLRQDQLEQAINTLSMLRKIHLKLFIHIPLDQSATKMSLQLFPPSLLPSLSVPLQK